MNDISHNTPRATLINSLLSPNHDGEADASVHKQADVMFGLLISDSRLDDELSVAAIEFSNTPAWLQQLNKDPCGFPKKTPFGTLWRGVDPNAVDEHGQSEFIRAVLKGDQDIYYPEMMAEFEDTDVNIQDNQGRTALHWACATDLSVMVKLCLSVPECDVGLRDNAGLTAFDLAPNEKIQTLFYRSIVEMDETAQMDALLRILTLTSVPVEAERPVFPGIALFDPVENRNRRLVVALIDRGVDLTARNGDGDTALHVAAAQRDGVEIATLLVHAGADVNALGNGGTTPLHYAAHIGQQDVARLLLDHGAEVGVKDENGATALQLAKDQRNQDLIDLLTGEMHIDQHQPLEIVAEKPEEPIHIDQHQPLKSVAEKPKHLMCERISDIELKDLNGLTALHRAVQAKDLDRVGELLLLGADTESLDITSRTALLIAARVDSEDIINKLLEAGADVRAANDCGTTALHYAAFNGSIGVIKLLLTEGADMYAVSAGWWSKAIDETASITPLELAALYQRHEVVKTLVQGGADLDVKGKRGNRWLSHAVKNRDVDLMRLLLDAGADADAEDAGGNTPLSNAVMNKDLDMVRLLLDAGADVEARDTTGRPALSYAVKNKDENVIKVLLDAGAIISSSDRVRYLALRAIGSVRTSE